MAREQVIKANMPLVYSIVKRFVGRGYDAEDLSQIGAIGLIKAVDNFNVNFEVKFSTYAVVKSSDFYAMMEWSKSAGH